MTKLFTSFLILMINFTLCGCTSQIFTVYLKDKHLLEFYKESVSAGLKQCVFSCFADEECTGAAYHKSRQKCYLYNTVPSCSSSITDIGMVTFLVQGSFHENIALNKPTTMSSVFESMAACRAVDGSLGDYAHTHSSNREWWCVDLEKKYNFQSIVIYNRITGAQDSINRMKGFRLLLSDQGPCTLAMLEKAVPCYYDTRAYAQNVYTIPSCNQPGVSFSSRLIFLSPQPPNQLNFRELVVSSKD